MSDKKLAGREAGGSDASPEPSFAVTPGDSQVNAEGGELNPSSGGRPYRSARGSSGRRRRRKSSSWTRLIFLTLLLSGAGYGIYYAYEGYMLGHVSLDSLSTLRESKATGTEAFIKPDGLTPQLAVANLRWCLRQKVRLDTLEKIVSSNLEISRINILREEMGTLCVLQEGSQDLLAEISLQMEQQHASIVADTIDNQLLYIGTVEGAKWTSSSLVAEIQRLLDSLGYATGSIDGKLGRNTTIAIKAFQRDHGLEPNGKPSEKLRSSLRKELQDKRTGS